jgi:omega-hydroxy-beta-dihydromenaquinone-9 sulfotransferase
MPIFVAGTGRSGTTHLAQILGEHPDISTFEHESRFLIDPGGLEDLVRALTEAYTPFHADDALSRLQDLLRLRLTGKEEAFATWDVPGEVGQERYRRWVDRFLADLTWYIFDEATDRPGGGPYFVTSRRVGRYYGKRSELIALCRNYVNELFSGVAKDRGKRIWCEKTPFNLLSMAFLWELFPEATIVHIMRHPVAVAASFLDQTWAPSDVESVCSYLEPIYRRWLNFRDSYPGFDTRYVELRLEDLAVDWPSQRAALFSRLGLSDAQTASTIDAQRVAHLGRQLTMAEKDRIRQRLGFALTALGYQTPPAASVVLTMRPPAVHSP